MSMAPSAQKKTNRIARPPQIEVAATIAVRMSCVRSSARRWKERRSGARRSATGGGGGTCSWPGGCTVNGLPFPLVSCRY
jgi:hypothetical protein